MRTRVDVIELARARALILRELVERWHARLTAARMVGRGRCRFARHLEWRREELGLPSTTFRPRGEGKGGR